MIVVICGFSLNENDCSNMWFFAKYPDKSSTKTQIIEKTPELTVILNDRHLLT